MNETVSIVKPDKRTSDDRRHAQPPYFGEHRQGERRGTWTNTDSDHRTVNR